MQKQLSQPILCLSNKSIQVEEIHPTVHEGRNLYSFAWTDGKCPLSVSDFNLTNSA